RQKKYEETIVALAELSHSTIEVIRPLMQSLRDDGLVVACRAAKLSWETTAAVLECRYSTGSVGAAELGKAKSHFNGTTIEHARRMLSFWRVRSPVPPSRTNCPQTVNRAPSWPVMASRFTVPGTSPATATGTKCSVRPTVALSISTS